MYTLLHDCSKVKTTSHVHHIAGYKPRISCSISSGKKHINAGTFIKLLTFQPQGVEMSLSLNIYFSSLTCKLISYILNDRLVVKSPPAMCSDQAVDMVLKASSLLLLPGGIFCGSTAHTGQATDVTNE
jgi:hypothetical protein